MRPLPRRWPDLPDDVRATAIACASTFAHRHPTLKDDIWQEAKLAAWLAVQHYVPGPAKLTTHVWHCVKCALVRFIGRARYWNWSRRDRRQLRREVSERAILAIHKMRPRPDETDPDWILAALTPLQAQVMWYRFVVGLTLGQIGDLLHIDHSNVSAIIRRARARARRELDPPAGYS